MPGPDFPTGGVLVESRESAGRGLSRPAAAASACAPAGEVEKLKGGTWQIVVTEIPYQVQKSRLIERIAELLAGEEAAAARRRARRIRPSDVRIVLEPKSRNVDPEVLMEPLFRLTELEIRFPLNMNVLDAEQHAAGDDLARGAAGLPRPSPRGAAAPQPLSASPRSRAGWRCSTAISIAYLNLDEVIRIIREEDEPKAEMMQALEAHRRAGRGDPQHAAARACASSRRSRSASEHDELAAEQKDARARC